MDSTDSGCGCVPEKTATSAEFQNPVHFVSSHHDLNSPFSIVPFNLLSRHQDWHISLLLWISE